MFWCVFGVVEINVGHSHGVIFVSTYVDISDVVKAWMLEVFAKLFFQFWEVLWVFQVLREVVDVDGLIRCSDVTINLIVQIFCCGFVIPV